MFDLDNIDWNKYRIIGTYHFKMNGDSECWFKGEIFINPLQKQEFNDKLKAIFNTRDKLEREQIFKKFMIKNKMSDFQLINDVSDMICLTLDSISGATFVIQEKLKDGYETLEETMDKESFQLMSIFEREWTR